MLDKLAQVEARFDELTAQMARPDVASDYTQIAELARERAELEPLVNQYRTYKDVLTQIDDARALLQDDDAGMVELAQAELEEPGPLH